MQWPELSCKRHHFNENILKLNGLQTPYKGSMAKTFPFYLIYSFNFARKSGSSTLRSSLPEAATSRAAALNMAPLPCLPKRPAALLTEQRPPRPPPLPCLAISDWSTLHKPVCRRTRRFSLRYPLLSRTYARSLVLCIKHFTTLWEIKS